MKKVIKRLVLICILLVTVIVLSGCSAATTSIVAKTEDQAKAVTDLTKKVNDLSVLTKKVKDLEDRASADDIVAQTKGRNLDLSGNAEFMKIESDLAMFFVSVKKVEPYADGVQVTLNIGNPMYATFTGLETKIKYAKTAYAMDLTSSGTDKYAEWEKTVLEKSIAIDTVLKPGIWNTVKLTIPAISPNDLKYLNLEIISSNSVSLTQP